MSSCEFSKIHLLGWAFKNSNIIGFLNSLRPKKVTPCSRVLQNLAKEYEIQKIQETTHHINSKFSLLGYPGKY